MASSNSRPETPPPSMAHSALARGAHFATALSTPSTSIFYGSSPSSQLNELFAGSPPPASDSAVRPSYYEILSTKTPTDPKANWHPEEGKYASWEEAEKAARRLINAVAGATPGSGVFEGGNKFWVVDASMLTIVQYQITAVHDASDTASALGRSDISSAPGQALQTDDELYRSPSPSKHHSQNEDQQELQGMDSLGVKKDTPAYSAHGDTPDLEELMTIKQEQDDTPLASIPQYPTPIPEVLSHEVSQGTRETPIEVDDQVSGQSTPAAQVAATTQPTIEPAAPSVTHAEPTEKAQQYVSSGRFGLYLTIARPSSVPVTYLVHLNTSLGQAQSDMKVIATNEIKKDVTENANSLPHITFNDYEVEIEKNEGAQLVYEIVEGSFVDGRFQSHMEQSGRATGESYTKEMMRSAPAYQHVTQATMGTPDVTGDVFETNETTSSREDAGTFDGGQGSVADIQNVRGEPTEHTEAVLHNEQDLHQAGDIVMYDTDSQTVIKNQDEQQQPTQVASPSRKRSREPDNDNNIHPRGTKKTASSQPPRKKAKTVIKKDTEDEDDEMMDVPDNKVDGTTEGPNAVYCRCKEVDDGTSMVGCDGEDCPSGGWVHWRCISTKKEKPGEEAESWLCPDCDPEKKNKKKGGSSYSWTRAAISKGAAAKKKRGGAASKKRLVR